MLSRIFSQFLVKKVHLVTNNVQLRPTFLVRSLCTMQDNDLDNEYTLTDGQIEDICESNSELERKLRLILMEMNVLKYDNLQVPSIPFVDKEDWLELCSKSGKLARLKYYGYLFKTEMSKKNDKLQKLKKAQDRAVAKEKQDAYFEQCRKEGKLIYSLTDNTMFIRIYEATMMNYLNYKLVQAMLFNQKIVIDCGFDDNMTKREAKNCAKQLMFLFAHNRNHIDPYDLHFCNVNYEKTVMKELNKFIRPLREPWFPLNLHENSYLDLFPKEKLVYLTPHCNAPLKKHDGDDVYIIGGIVDKCNSEPLTLAKAKVEGIRMAKLPIDDYVLWGTGSAKNLTVEQVIRILLDLKVTNDWKYALKHVPKRKLLENQKHLFDQELRDKIADIRQNRKALIKR